MGGRWWTPSAPKLGAWARVSLPWVGLAALAAAAVLAFRPSHPPFAAEPLTPAAAASPREAIDALAFRLALLEGRANAPALREATTREVLALLALQEVSERAERGLPFDAVMPSLAAIVAGDGVAALQTLGLHAARGVATARGLEAEFARLRPLLESQSVAPDTSGMARALTVLQGLAADLHILDRPPAAAVPLALSRMAEALALGRLDGVLAEAEVLQGTARQVAGGWLSAVRARGEVLAAVEQLRRSLWQALARSP
jgi:hypothetical protein